MTVKYKQKNLEVKKSIIAYQLQLHNITFIQKINTKQIKVKAKVHFLSYIVVNTNPSAGDHSHCQLWLDCDWVHIKRK